jgi:hypothetical protein
LSESPHPQAAPKSAAKRPHNTTKAQEKEIAAKPQKKKGGDFAASPQGKRKTNTRTVGKSALPNFVRTQSTLAKTTQNANTTPPNAPPKRTRNPTRAEN